MIRAIIVDDEKHALNALKDLLAEYDDIQIVGEFTSSHQALEQSKRLAYDIAFLDIEMPELQGLELGEKLLESNPARDIVFITAFDAYAVEAFEIHALDYLLKPVSPRRMRKTIERLKIKYAEVQEVSSQSQTSVIPSSRVRCFGRFEVLCEAAEEGHIPWRTAKVRELLAYLIHHRGEAVHKTRIIEDVWPSMEPDKASVYLHTCVYQIRKTLKKYEMDRHIHIRFIKEGYQLQLQDLTTDVDEYLGVLRDHHLSLDRLLEKLGQAIQLYGSGYFDKEDYPWSLEVKGRLEEEYHRLLLRMADQQIVMGRVASAIQTLRELVHRNPWNEDIYEKLFKLYAEEGDRTSLAQLYQQMKTQYRTELGIDPRVSTEEMYRMLMDQLSASQGRTKP